MNTSRTPNIAPNLSFRAVDIANIKFGKKSITITTKLGDTFKVPYAGGFPELLVHISGASSLVAQLTTGISAAVYGGTFFNRHVPRNDSYYSSSRDEDDEDDDDEDEDADEDCEDEDEDDDGEDEDEDDDGEDEDDDDDSDWTEDSDSLVSKLSAEQKAASIEAAGFTPFVLKTIRAAGINTIADFYVKYQELLLLKGIGSITAEKMNQQLVCRGFPAIFR